MGFVWERHKSCGGKDLGRTRPAAAAASPLVARTYVERAIITLEAET